MTIHEGMPEQNKREKVIRAYECSINKMPNDRCQNCPYGYEYYDESGDSYFWWCDQDKMMDDALELMKAQEPVEPTIGRCEEYDGHDSWWYQCGKCNTPIDDNDKYCKMCGQAVKWE